MNENECTDLRNFHMRRCLLLAGLALFPAASFGGTDSGFRSIIEIGCHRADNTCWVEISGEPVGPVACRSISLRWNEASDANGRSLLALLSTAFAAGRFVNFHVSDSCYVLQPTAPTFDWINVR